jgi:thiol-disulfide isomerase/thioredoxin
VSRVNPNARASSKRSMRLLMPSLVVALGLLIALPALALDDGARAPEIGLKDIDGDVIRMADLRGKVVLVDFWATWCGPCREELPFLEELQDRHEDEGFVVVGVNVDRDRRNMESFVRRLGLSFPNVYDGEHAVAGRYGPSSMPTSYLVDRQGVVRHIFRGFRAADATALERHVEALLRAR